MKFLILSTGAILFSIIYGLLVVWYSAKFLEAKTSKNTFAVFAVLAGIGISTVAIEELPYPVLYFLIYVLILLTYLVFFRGGWLRFLFGAGNFLFHLLFMKGILLWIYSWASGLTLYELIANTYRKYGMSIVICVAASLLLLIFRFFISDDMIEKLCRSKLYLKMIVVVEGTLNIFLISYAGFYYYENMPPQFTMFYGLVCLMCACMFYILFLYFINEIKKKEYVAQNDQLQEVLVNQLEHYKSQVKYLNEFRKIKHDYSNQLAAFKYLLLNKEYDGALELLKESGQQFEQLQKRFKRYSDNTLVDVILKNCAEKCKELGIAFQAEIEIGSRYHLANLEICNLFTNLSDNAVEACVKTEKKEKRFISFHYTEKDGWLTIICENSYNGEVEYDENRIMTSKRNKESHGLGLMIIESIAKEHKGFVDIDILDRTFRVLVHLKSLEEGVKDESK